MPPRPDGRPPAGARALARRAFETVVEDLRHAAFSFPANTMLGSPFVPRILRMAGYRVLGIDVRVADVHPRVWFKTRRVTLGAHVTINSGTAFDSSARVMIGRLTRVGYQVMFCTSSHRVGDPDARAAQRYDAPITVGDGCWIGTRAMLLPGVTVGDGCVIAAGAVVVADCEPNGVYAGVPARRVRDLPVTRTEEESALSRDGGRAHERREAA